ALSQRRPGPRTRATARTVSPPLSWVRPGHGTIDTKHNAEGRGGPMDAEQPRAPIEPASGQVPNAGQLEQWAREGEQWVAEADRYDAMLQSFGAAVLAAASLSPGERVADVGCGNGAMTIDAARRVGPNGRALGIDISIPMLDLARRRAKEAGVGNVEFVEADAQVHPFGGGSLDAILSRFGVMFFDDPQAAFANFASALRPRGRIALVCWQ